LVIGQATLKKQTTLWLAPITTCYVKAERMGAWGRNRSWIITDIYPIIINIPGKNLYM